MLAPENRLYIFLNVLGAGLAGYASYLIDFGPFVVLEGIWVAVGLASWFRLGGARG